MICPVHFLSAQNGKKIICSVDPVRWCHAGEEEEEEPPAGKSAMPPADRAPHPLLSTVVLVKKKKYKIKDTTIKNCQKMEVCYACR